MACRELGAIHDCRHLPEVPECILWRKGGSNCVTSHLILTVGPRSGNNNPILCIMGAKTFSQWDPIGGRIRICCRFAVKLSLHWPYFPGTWDVAGVLEVSFPPSTYWVSLQACRELLGILLPWVVRPRGPAYCLSQSLSWDLTQSFHWFYNLLPPEATPLRENTHSPIGISDSCSFQCLCFFLPWSVGIPTWRG
jgi:hypothetical protein